VCISKSDEGFLNPLSKELTHRGIKHRINGNQICFNKNDKNEVIRIDTYVSSYRNGVATLLDNEEKEKQITAWLIKEKKSYEITETTNGRRLLIIHSNSESDAEKNRKALSNFE
jgi:hypothetical protein